MARWRDFLDRFRPAGAPGAAGPHAAPVDRAAEAAAELLPVLRRLDSVQDEAERLRADAEENAARIRADGLARARTIVETARAATESIAADTTAAILAQAPGDGRTEDTAVALRARTRQRLPEYVRLVVDRARTDLDALAAPERKPLS